MDLREGKRDISPLSAGSEPTKKSSSPDFHHIKRGHRPTIKLDGFAIPSHFHNLTQSTPFSLQMQIHICESSSPVPDKVVAVRVCPVGGKFFGFKKIYDGPRIINIGLVPKCEAEKGAKRESA